MEFTLTRLGRIKDRAEHRVSLEASRRIVQRTSAKRPCPMEKAQTVIVRNPRFAVFGPDGDCAGTLRQAQRAVRLASGRAHETHSCGRARSLTTRFPEAGAGGGHTRRGDAVAVG